MEELKEYDKILTNCVSTSEELLTALNDFKSAAQTLLPKTKDGISFFDVKNRQLFSYLGDLSLLMSKMSVGESIENHPAIDRLIHRRVVLEKMKPIEVKLRPQIDRLLSAKKTSADNQQVLRARPDQFVIDDDNDEDEEDNEEGQSKSKKYVPPKIHAVQYDGDDEEKQQRHLEQARKRMLQSSLVKELHAQYSQAPEEIVDEHKMKEAKSEAERRKYEETYMVRLQVSKKQQSLEQRKRQRDDLSALLNFGDYMGNKDDEDKKSKRKRKFKGPKEDKETRTKKFKAAAKSRFTAKKKKPGQKAKTKKRKH